MEALRNIKLVEAARQAAITLVAQDSTLSQYPLLIQRAASFETLHFE
jgi:hypothetical protein